MDGDNTGSLADWTGYLWVQIAAESEHKKGEESVFSYFWHHTGFLLGDR